MPRDILPPSPFGAGTTYTGHSEHVVAPRETHEQSFIPPRISRVVGNAAMRNAVALPRISRLDFSASEAPTEEIPAVVGHEMRSDGQYAFPQGKGASELRVQTTPESEQDATRMFETVGDPEIRELINHFAGKTVEPAQVQGLLRDNNALRAQLGVYLRNKLEGNVEFWGHEKSQVARNAMKNTPAGYEKMPSRDYAVQLALAMLDGTFKLAESDLTAMAQNGMVENGEHRIAAARLLRFSAPEHK